MRRVPVHERTSGLGLLILSVPAGRLVRTGRVLSLFIILLVVVGLRAVFVGPPRELVSRVRHVTTPHRRGRRSGCSGRTAPRASRRLVGNGSLDLAGRGTRGLLGRGAYQRGWSWDDSREPVRRHRSPDPHHAPGASAAGSSPNTGHCLTLLGGSRPATGGSGEAAAGHERSHWDARASRISFHTRGAGQPPPALPFESLGYRG